MNISYVKITAIVMIVAVSVILVNAESAPFIISWSNSKTNDSATDITVNVGEEINFNATADQPITNWYWTRMGNEQVNNYDNFTTFFNTIGEKTVSVYAENSNGETNTITWTINVINPPEIISWNNSKTANMNLNITIQMEEDIAFSATADQDIISWNWYKDGIAQEANAATKTFSDYITSWDNVGIRHVSVNATNEKGTSNTITWEIIVLSNTGVPQNKGREIDFNVTMGELLGDLIVLVRDENGEPLIDENGCYIAVNETDLTWIYYVYDPDTESCDLSDADLEYTIPVEFGRLSIARTSPYVIDSAFDEAIKSLNSALKIELDPAGRFLLTKETIDEYGEPYTYQKPIDSSLENIGLYKKIMLDGNLLGNLGDYDYVDVGDPALPPELRPTLDVDHFLEVSEGTDMEYLVDDVYDGDDQLRAASLLAAAADKTGVIEVDMVVYLNSILGLNVIDESDVTYVDFSPMDYDRAEVYTKNILVLQEEFDNGVQVDDHWIEILVPLYDEKGRNPNVFTFDHDLLPETHLYYNPDFEPFTSSISGFVQASDDSLRVIHFTHTYQIPSLR